MFVNTEFLGEEPIENVITCMHHKFDKVIFFGYQNVIQEQKGRIDRFLTKYCGVKDIIYCALPGNDLGTVLDKIHQVVTKEMEQGSRIYFDITGGESLVLVAFGILAKEFCASIHQYDVAEDKLMEFAVESNSYLSREVPPHRFNWNLDQFVELYGGIINKELHKDIKNLKDAEFANDVDILWNMIEKYGAIWNCFCAFLRENLVPDNNLQVTKSAADVLRKLARSNNKLNSVHLLNDILNDLEANGILRGLLYNDEKYEFQIKNQMVKECLWESGSVLELHVYKMEKRIADDCRVGVYLDWDGTIMPAGNPDVINEIDVLSLTGNIPTFISCKSGNMNGTQILHAFYELETVAQRFGGKYAKKILVTTNPISSSYMERADEMGIIIQRLS